jgi:1-acyl-sn-glycerol-3-phosphate acyltransferase
MQYARSILFFFYIYAAMAVIGIGCAPLALWSRGGAEWTMRLYARAVMLGARVLIGLRCEVRGPAPTGEVIVASKHQSFLDILMLFSALETPRYIMKRSLRWAPILGFYAMRIGCAPVDRGGKSGAVKKMVEASAATRHIEGQIIIFPQGTRVSPSAKLPYKGGVHALAEGLGVPVHLAATNVGLFWPRGGLLRKPGLAVVEFLGPMTEGLNRKDMTAEMEARIEAASEALYAEARALDPSL